MSNKIWTVCMAALCVCGLAIAVYAGLFAECGGMLDCGGKAVPMKCHWTYIVVAALGVVQVLFGIIGLLQKQASGRRVAALAAIIVAAVSLLVLFVLLGVCTSADMSCNNSQPIVAVLEVLALAVAAIGCAKADATKDDMPKAKL